MAAAAGAGKGNVLMINASAIAGRMAIKIRFFELSVFPMPWSLADVCVAGSPRRGGARWSGWRLWRNVEPKATAGAAAGAGSARLAAMVAVLAALAACGSAPGTTQQPSAPAQQREAPTGALASAASRPSAGGISAAMPHSGCPAWLAQQQAGQGRLYQLDPAQSTVRILVFRAGRLAALGHHHVIGAEQQAAGHVYLPKDGLATAGAELAFRLDQLVLDAPAWRAAMGGEFAKPLSEADIAGTRANMLKALDAQQFPVVSARSVSVEGAWPRPILKLEVSLHGQSRQLDLPLEAVQPEGEQALRARGRLVVRQTDFGIRPFAVLGGLLAIQDALLVELDLAALPATACAAWPQG